MVTRAIFRGSFVPRRLLKKQLTKIKLHQYASKNWRQRWKRSGTRLLNSSIGRQLTQCVGIRTKIRAINVFTYLRRKLHKIKFHTHQNHIWHSYHSNKKFFSTYYDLVNAFYIFTFIVNTEQFIIFIIKYSLIKIHRRKIKPQKFFYFIDNVIKTIPSIKEKFHACRVIITGKLRGGTARTGSYIAGFGSLPRQSISANITIAFGNIESKYGAFGVKLVSWRKTFN